MTVEACPHAEPGKPEVESERQSVAPDRDCRRGLAYRHKAGFIRRDNYHDYVKIQSETAVRHLANEYAYDHGEEGEITLRSGLDEVSGALQQELQARLSKAGVVVEEARLTHLAYAPEIAGAMLRRQQAEAVIAARQMIVHGAVSMVELALKELAEKQVVELDNDRKVAMVSNLLVVLCGEAETHPIINAGTLYT